MGMNFKIPEKVDADSDVLLPIMSLMLILIPILVGNMAFYHFHKISVNAPAINTAQDASEMTPEEKKKTAVMARLRIDNRNFNLELLDENSGAILLRKEISRGKTGTVELRKALEGMIEEFAKLDVLLFSSYSQLKYQDLMIILDEGIKSIVDPLTQKARLKIVMVSQEV